MTSAPPAGPGNGAGGRVQVFGGAGGITANRESIVRLGREFAAQAEQLRGCGAWLQQGPPLDTAYLFHHTAFLAEAGSSGRAETLLAQAAQHLDDLGASLARAASTYPWGSEVLTTALGPSPGVLFDALARVADHPFDPMAGLSDAVTHEPGLLDHAVNDLDVAGLTRVLAATDDGAGVAVPGVRLAVTPPRSLPDLVAALGRTDAEAPPGGIDVHVLTGADGRQRAIVDLTGTRTWGSGGAEVADLYTNERALTGRPTAYERGVLDALQRAGVSPDDDVMLVGHSQGGMVAVDAARDAVASGRFHVTHVITAGSPIGLSVGSLPRSVRVLALENSQDVVPHADGRPNPDLPNVTTVVEPEGDHTVSGDHSIAAAYQPIARDAAASGRRSVRDFLHTARGYFRGESAAAQRFQVLRTERPP